MADAERNAFRGRTAPVRLKFNFKFTESWIKFIPSSGLAVKCDDTINGDVPGHGGEFERTLAQDLTVLRNTQRERFTLLDCFRAQQS